MTPTDIKAPSRGGLSEAHIANSAVGRAHFTGAWPHARASLAGLSSIIAVPLP